MCPLCKQQKTYTAAIAGLGRIAFSLGFDKLREQPASHTMALLNSRRVRIAGGCDLDAKKRSEWQDYVSCRQHSKAQVYSDARAMFNECKADIAVVAVNESSHLQMALQAIEAKPRLVILEKPVALNSLDGKKIADASSHYSVPVMINHERRFAEDYLMARQYIASGKIGDVQSVTAELESSLRVYSPDETGTGAYSLIHDGTHLVDITRFLLGDAELSSASLVCLARDEKDSRIVRNLSVHFAAKAGIDGAGDSKADNGKAGVIKADGEKSYSGEEDSLRIGALLPISCPDVLIKISGRSHFFHFGVEVLGTKGRVRVGNGFAQFEQSKKSKLYTGFYSLCTDRGVKRIRKTRYFSNMIQSAIDYLDGKAPLASSLKDGLIDISILEDMRAFCDALQ